MGIIVINIIIAVIKSALWVLVSLWRQKSIYFSDKSKYTFSGFTHLITPLCLTLYALCQHPQIHRQADGHVFACVEMLRPAAAWKVRCSSPLMSLSIRVWAPGQHTHTHTQSMLCWFKSCCYVGFCSELINTHYPSLSHKNTARGSTGVFRLNTFSVAYSHVWFYFLWDRACHICLISFPHRCHDFMHGYICIGHGHHPLVSLVPLCLSHTHTHKFRQLWADSFPVWPWDTFWLMGEV